MLSFWENNSFVHHDIIIIGGGIVGMSIAASILEDPAHKGLSVLIIERGILPTGASTKNAGFACFGSLTEVLSDLAKMPEQDVLALIESRYTGLTKLRKRLGDIKIDYLGAGGYELLSDNELYAVDKLDTINQFLKPLFNDSIYALANDKIEDFGFNNKIVKALVYNKLEGQIDTGLTIKNLYKHIVSLGAQVWTGTALDSYYEDNGSVRVEVRSGNNKMSFDTKKIIFATNAFTTHFFPALDIQPGRGQVLITKPLDHIPFVGSFHMEEGYYYFRNYRDRVLFGGGRNLDFDTEATLDLGHNAYIQSVLADKLHNIILPNQKVEIDYFWSGIMAFGNTKLPILQYINDNIIIAARMNGMGVALASEIGDRVNNMIKQKI
jgi:glycine/D-amino acid oxidase-like deaminating enzyme